MVYKNKHIEDFYAHASEISFMIPDEYDSFGDADYTLRKVARTLLDVYNQGFDDAVKTLGEIKKENK